MKLWLVLVVFLFIFFSVTMNAFATVNVFENATFNGYVDYAFVSHDLNTSKQTISFPMGGLRYESNFFLAEAEGTIKTSERENGNPGLPTIKVGVTIYDNDYAKISFCKCLTGFGDQHLNVAGTIFGLEVNPSKNIDKERYKIEKGSIYLDQLVIGFLSSLDTYKVDNVNRNEKYGEMGYCKLRMFYQYNDNAKFTLTYRGFTASPSSDSSRDLNCIAIGVDYKFL